MNHLSTAFTVAGGLALFLYGLSLLSRGLQKAAGDRLRFILEKLTDKPVKGVIVGLIVTATIQSSSITTVTLIGLINSGLMSLEQAVGVVLGAEIGTTVTAQIVSFKIGKMFFPLIAIGFFLFFLGKKDKHKFTGQIILGFGILFLGMNTMSSALKPLKDNRFFVEALANFGKIPLLGVIAGAVFTGIIQSSSATTGLIIAMGKEKIISLNAAIPIILGANIGTCVTALIASVGSSLSSKRTAMSHLLFNLIGVTLFFPFLGYFAQIVSLTSPEIPRQIANAHTMFNTTMTLIMLPCVRLLIALVKKIVPGEEPKVDRGVLFLEEKLLHTPPIAIGQAKKETMRMANIVKSMLENSEKALLTMERKFVLPVLKNEETVDELDNAIESYLTKISNLSLSQSQSREIAILIHSISDIERVADHAHNIAELAEYMKKEKIVFSKNALEELKGMFDAARESYIKAIDVLSTKDENLARKVLDLEVTVDHMQRELEKNHFERLKKGICSPEAGPIYLDIIRNLERISDHAHNIAYVTIIGF
ncbi:Na/Pi cotransporter family protein [Candidatus Aerophobetes bacterium]|nr:Na/Pi cotransporter family protein [Candidatus Aerophobetes bacterium]